jgi:nitrogenase molybdenum-cofactor synthesis protein NifE
MVDAIPPREMYAQLVAAKADILLSGGRTQFIALKARTPWLDINQERHYAYAAYDGMVELIQQLDREINNPVWQEVRRVAPWDEPAERTSSLLTPGSINVAAE